MELSTCVIILKKVYISNISDAQVSELFVQSTSISSTQHQYSQNERQKKAEQLQNQ